MLTTNGPSREAERIWLRMVFSNVVKADDIDQE
jgi:hypothetical protein